MDDNKLKRNSLMTQEPIKLVILTSRKKELRLDFVFFIPLLYNFPVLK